MSVSNADVAGVLGRYVAGLAVPITSRATFPAHVTCAAVVVTPDWRMLEILHGTLGLWLPPGGHVEETDRTLLDAALRELAEETGVVATAADAVGDGPFDVSAHGIPARPGRGEPAHTHIDLRFLLRLPERPVTVEPAEVRDFRWRPVEEVTGALGDRLRAVRSAFTQD